MAKNTDLRTEIVITCNAKNADAEIKNIKKSISAIDKEINNLSKQGKGDTPYAKWLRKLRSSLNSFQRESVKGAERVQKAVANLAGTSTNELRRARRAAQQFRDSLASNDKRFAEANANLAKIQAQIDKNTGAVKKHGSAWKTTIKNMMAYVGVFGVLNMVKSKIEEIINLNLKFSQQLADVRKVSGLTTKQVKDLGNELSKIDSRTSLQGLMTTAYSGAKLGFGEYGVQGLVDFTKAANVASVAIGEELGEDALPALSKIVENMGIIKKYGVEQSMLKTASAMFKLSSSSTATSNNIVEFSKRLTAMSKVAGITTDQLLALGSASDAMYLAPEVSATAFTKLISSIQTSHNLIEKTLGMTKGTINDLFSKGKAMDAIVMIFEKMNKLGNMNALKPIFKDLGSDGARLMNVMTAMAKNVDVLKNHLNMSADAFRDGTAATAEYNIQQGTAEGLMERAKNLWQKAVMNPEEVDVVHDFAKAWFDVSKSLTSNEFAMFTLKMAISELLFALKTVLYLLPGLLAGLGSAGLFAVVMQLVSAFQAAKTATQSFSIAWTTMSKTTKATWIGLIIGTIVELTYTLYSFAKAANNATPSLGKLNMSLDDFRGNLRRSVNELKDYRRAIDRAGDKTQERAAAIANFNKMYGKYLKNMLSEASTADQVAKAYERVVSALRGKLALEGKQADIKKYVQPRVNWSATKLQVYDDYNRRVGDRPSQNAEWLKAFVDDRLDKRYSAPRIAREIRKYLSITKDELPNLNKHIGSDPGKFSWTDFDRRKLAALNYIYQENNRRYLEGRVTQKWKPYEKDINTATIAEGQIDNPGTLDNDAADKDAIKAEKAAAAAAREERAKKIRDANERFKNAKEEATAVVSAIDEYYTLQKEAIEQMYNDGKATRVKADSLKMWLENRRLQVQVEAHKALGGRDNQFEDMKKELGWGYDRVDQSTNSDASEKIIKNFNGPATYKLLSSFSGGDGMPDGRSIINDINKKGAEMKLKLTEANGKVIKAVDDYFNQFDVVKDVSDDLAEQLTNMGVVFEKPKNFFKGQEADHKDKQDLDPSAIGLQDVTVVASAPDTTQMKLLQDFILNGNKNYGFDAKDSTQLGNWLKEFVTNGDWNAKEDAGTVPSKLQFQDWAKVMPDMENWVNDIPKYQQQIQSFYISLLAAEDNYYNKMKANTDREKRILDERFARSDSGKRYEQEERDLQVTKGIQNIYGRGETGAFLNTQEMARNNGFADNIANDPEVMLAEEQMRKMREKLKSDRQTEDDQQAIQAAEQAAQDAELAYADKINSQIKARIDLLQQWVDPLQEFAESMGDAFAKMTDSAEEGRDAMKQATESMVKTFAKMTVNMITQQLKMEVQRALFHKRMQKSEADYMEGMKDENDKGHKNIFKALGSFFKKKKKEQKNNSKSEHQQAKKDNKEQTAIVEDAQEKQQAAVTESSKGMVNIKQKMGQQTEQMQQEQSASEMSTTATETTGNVFAGIASGAAKIISALGWWGIPLVAVISGLLMGLLNSALGKLFGGSEKSETSTNTKLVSGMLTYDSGNVEAFSGAIDKKTYPVVGNDGKVYAAKPTDSLVTGLLTEPVATMVNGVPSLIAERGPEMIIGRETTQALMMARPDIISEIVQFDRNHSGKTYRAYDQGNVSDVVSNLSTSSLSASQQPAMQADWANLAATMQAMIPAMQAFTSQIKKPMKTYLNMYGKEGLYEGMSKANRFMKGKR